MPKYRLLYFNLRGRAEPARWIFVYAGQDYTDDRFESVQKDPQKWKDIKPTTPYGKVPVLYVDEKPICSTLAICAYLGKQLGLNPSDPMQEAICYEAVDTINDLVTPVGKMARAKLENKKEEAQLLLEQFLTNLFPSAAKGLCTRLKASGYFGGDKISWADLYIICFLTEISERVPGLLSNYPELAALQQKVLSNPAIAKWIKERPATSM